MTREISWLSSAKKAFKNVNKIWPYLFFNDDGISVFSLLFVTDLKVPNWTMPMTSRETFGVRRSKWVLPVQDQCSVAILLMVDFMSCQRLTKRLWSSHVRLMFRSTRFRSALCHPIILSLTKPFWASALSSLMAKSLNCSRKNALWNGPLARKKIRPAKSLQAHLETL